MDFLLVFRLLILLGAVAAAIFMTLKLLKTHPERMDLKLVLISIEHLQRNETVYFMNGLFDHNKPPLILLLWLPLVWISWSFVAAVWPMLTIFCTTAVVIPFSMDAAILGFVLNFRAIFSEVMLGQYNLFALAPVVLARAYSMPGLLGVATAVMLLEKTTLLPVVIWAWAPYLPREFQLRLDRSQWKLLGGFLGSCAAISVLFASIFGVDRLMGLHHEWWAHLKVSEGFHIMRVNNFGIPSLAARIAGHPVPGMTFGLLFLSMLGLLAFWWKRPKDSNSLLMWSAAVFVLVSPMTWRQNFIVFVPALAPFCLMLFQQLENQPWKKVMLNPQVLVIFAGMMVMNFSSRGNYRLDLSDTVVRLAVVCAVTVAANIFYSCELGRGAFGDSYGPQMTSL
jgi:hypothetical protein